MTSSPGSKRAIGTKVGTLSLSQPGLKLIRRSKPDSLYAPAPCRLLLYTQVPRYTRYLICQLPGELGVGASSMSPSSIRKLSANRGHTGHAACITHRGTALGVDRRYPGQTTAKSGMDPCLMVSENPDPSCLAKIRRHEASDWSIYFLLATRQARRACTLALLHVLTPDS